jgi:hypothetical protein
MSAGRARTLRGETMTDFIQVGTRSVSTEQAFAWAQTYLADIDGRWAYPAYDGYCGGQLPDQLDQADLLAPILLNVPVKLRTYYGLLGLIEHLNSVLKDIPVDADLRSASPEELHLLGRLFSVLDDERPHGVRATTLAKVLHRKRPGLIPLYDRQVRTCYREGPDAPVPFDASRSWQDCIVLLAVAMQKDLMRHEDAWMNMTKIARTVPITPLRALDIIAWHAGQEL